MTEFVALNPKTYSYLTDDCKEDKRRKEQRSVSSNEDLNLMIIDIAC